jgi:hypothetical protein
MSRPLSLVLSALSLGCAPGVVSLDDPAATGTDDTAGLPPLVSVDVGGGCDASLETPPNNACDGEPVLGLDLVGVRDADGDGLWSAGEVLEIDLEIFANLDDPEGWVNYPGVFAHLPAGVSVVDGGGPGEVTWFYAVMSGQPQPLTARIVAEEAVAPGSELVFTVGALNCESNQMWGPCPTPSPLTVTIGG